MREIIRDLVNYHMRGRVLGSLIIPIHEKHGADRLYTFSLSLLGWLYDPAQGWKTGPWPIKPSSDFGRSVIEIIQETPGLADLFATFPEGIDFREHVPEEERQEVQAFVDANFRRNFRE